MTLSHYNIHKLMKSVKFPEMGTLTTLTTVYPDDKTNSAKKALKTST